MTDCIVITKMTLFIIAIAWALLSGLLIWIYPWPHPDSDLSIKDWIMMMFVSIGILIFLILTCLLIGWFLFSYLPSIICIKIV
jgi:hypothetical protein